MIKRFLIILIGFLLIFSIFYLLFVTMNFFPSKYYLVDESETRLVLETGLFNKERVVIYPENNAELVIAIIKHSLRQLDILLIGIGSSITLTILAIINYFLNKERKVFLLNTFIFLASFILLLYVYFEEIERMKIYINL